MTPFKVSLVVLVSLAGVAAASAAAAQTQQDWRSAKEIAPAATPLVLEQSYHGTRPGEGNALPRVEEIKGKPGSWITWPGFMMRPDSGSRLFLQTTRELAYEKIVKKNRVRLEFKDAQVFLSNNRNPLVTMNFNTPLKTAYLKRDRKNVQLVMDLKVASEVVITQSTDADGYCYLFVDFPLGQFDTNGEWRPQAASPGGGSYSATSLSRPSALSAAPAPAAPAGGAAQPDAPIDPEEIPAPPAGAAQPAGASPPSERAAEPAAPAAAPREDSTAQDPESEIFTGE